MILVGNGKIEIKSDKQILREAMTIKPATQTKYCAFCLMQGIMQRATFEGRAEDYDWAYMCPRHFAKHGIGLGLGKGKRLDTNLTTL